MHGWWTHILPKLYATFNSTLRSIHGDSGEGDYTPLSPGCTPLIIQQSSLSRSEMWIWHHGCWFYSAGVNLTPARCSYMTTPSGVKLTPVLVFTNIWLSSHTKAGFVAVDKIISIFKIYQIINHFDVQKMSNKLHFGLDVCINTKCIDTKWC